MKEHTKIVLILALAAGLRLVYLSESLLYNPTFFAPIIDAYTYSKLALAQVGGAGMGPESVWQPLFYPYFLSACYYIFGAGFFSARIVQMVLGLLTCVLTYLLGAKLFNARVGLIAALLVSICGTLIFYEGELLPTTWEVFWFFASIAAFMKIMPGDRERETRGSVSAQSYRVEEEPPILPPSPLGGGHGEGGNSPCIPDSLWVKGGYVSFMILGAVCAVGVMIRPNILFFYLAAWVWLLAQCRRQFPWKSILGRVVGAAVGASLVLGPVLIRNHSLTQKWILFPVSGGLNFYIGNNPEADKTVAIRPGDQWYQLTVSPRKEGILHAPEGPRYFYRKSYEFIRNQPRAFLKGLAIKTERLFSAKEIPRNIDIYLFRRYSRVLRILVWRIGGFGFPMGIILPAALFGVLINLRRFRRLAFLYIYVAAYSLSIVLFFVSTRYRMPLLPVLCLFAASGLWCVYEEYIKRDHLTLLGSLAALAILFFFCNRALIIPEDAVNFESELYMALGTVHLERGEWAEGEYYLRKSIDSDPQNADSLALLGLLEFEKGEFDQAGRELTRALVLRPRHVGALKNLGRLYWRTHKPDQAKECLIRAEALDPGSDEIHYYLASLYEETGDIQEAVREYWKALELKPDSIDMRRRLAVILGRAGRWEIARELIQEAVRHEPDNADLRFDLGIIYGGMGRSREAVSEFQRALKTRPDFPIALLNLGIMYSTIGDKENALAQYQKLKLIDGIQAQKLKEELDTRGSKP